MTKIVFLKVTDAPSKLNAITQTVHEQLDLGKKILIAVPNQEAAAYVDQLLWKIPEESFSPHIVTTTQVNELVAITTSTTNVNQATVLINLNPQIHPSSAQFEVIFDLYDTTHPSKEELSQSRQAEYTKSL